jgi:hypothetical protein
VYSERKDSFFNPRTFVVAAVLALFAFWAAAWFFRQPLPVRFKDRSILPITGLERYLYREPSIQEIAAYTDVANKALLVRSLSVVDHPDWLAPAQPNRFSFPCLAAFTIGVSCDNADATAGQALRTAFNTQEDVYKALNQHWSALAPSRTIDTMPLILLAVVNRIDLASIGCQPDGDCTRYADPGYVCTPTMICGAEVRFVYAGTSNDMDHYFTLILEFTLPNLSKGDFIALAQQWNSLASVPDVDPKTDPPVAQNFAQSVGKVLAYCLDMKGVHGRMRISGRKDDAWELRQFSKDPNKPNFITQYLFQQPSDNIQIDNTCQQQGKAMANFAAANQPKILIAKYMFDGDSVLRTAGFDMSVSDAGSKDNAHVLTLADNVLGSDQPEETRHLLSLNSCAGCHGLETKKTDLTQSTRTPFDQIRVRHSG